MSQTSNESMVARNLRSLAHQCLTRDLNDPHARPEITQERRRQLLGLANAVASSPSTTTELTTAGGGR
jgi:hypothetical protein